MRVPRFPRWRFTAGLLLLTLSLCVGYRNVATQQNAADPPPPVRLTADEDHQRILDLLHISSLRRGPDGDPKSPNAANYDETKVGPLPNLPDPLLLKNRTKVQTPSAWWKQRRPEIVEEFDREIYGRVPKLVPKVHWGVVATTKEVSGDVPVITKKLLGHVDNSADPQIAGDIQLTLTLPERAPGPVPVMMELGLSPEQLAALAKRFPAAFPRSDGPSSQQQVLAKNWGYAVLIPTTAQPDNGDGLTEGIIGLANQGQPRKLDDWGALRAWAWGASRALDYLETEPAVNAKQVGIEGHSRYGKAALIAMAYDPRFAIAYISSSGAGGAKILRRNFGEQLENLAGTGEYHWMAGNFVKYAGPLATNDLPVDAHELIALCAPRPVFIGAGAIQGDGWTDPRGMFFAAVAAGPVYQLLGKKPLTPPEFPAIGTPLVDGDLAFRQHTEGHTPTPNWPAFLEFASRYIKSPPTVSTSQSHEVALTFDDLPVHGPLPNGVTRVDVANSIIRALQAAHAPPIYGFVNAKKLEDDPSSGQVLQLWRAAGFPLANHTFSHMDLHTNTVEAFEQDLMANEPILKSLMADQDWHWFRFPYLRAGDSVEKHRAVAAFLKQRGYRLAEVTLSFGDYAYNGPYTRCAAKNDQQGIDFLRQSYLEGAAESLMYGFKISNQLYGRDIKHIMLLHVGSFQTIMLPRLLELLQQRHFQLITLPQAEADPAYATDPDLTKWDGTFLEQMLEARHTPQPQESAERLSKLDKVCQ